MRRRLSAIAGLVFGGTLLLALPYCGAALEERAPGALSEVFVNSRERGIDATALFYSEIGPLEKMLSDGAYGPPPDDEPICCTPTPLPKP